MGKWSEDGADRSFSLLIDSGANDELTIAFCDPDEDLDIFDTTDANLASSTWYNIVFSWTDTARAVYVNGSSKTLNSVADNTTTPIQDCTNDFEIGFDGTSGGTYLDGIITEVAVWTSALTQADANQLALSRIKGMPLQVDPSNLQGYWPMDEKAVGTDINGVTFVDSTGNNNGTGSDAGGQSTFSGEEVLSYPSNPIIF